MKHYFLTSLIVFLLIVVGAVVIVAEKNNPLVLPGSPLFEAKLMVENFEVSLLPTPVQKSDFLLTLASERVLEAEKLVDNGESWRLSQSFGPMRSELLQATDLAGSIQDKTARSSQMAHISSQAIAIQSRLYDIKADTPDQNQDALALNIVSTDELAQATTASSDYLTAGSGANLALAPSPAVLGASDVRTNYTSVVGLVAIILIPLAVFLPLLLRRLRHRA